MSVDDHRHLMTGEGPASCTGCDWKSRQIGISSMTQHEEHRKRLAALDDSPADQPTTEPSDREVRLTADDVESLAVALGKKEAIDWVRQFPGSYPEGDQTDPEAWIKKNRLEIGAAYRLLRRALRARNALAPAPQPAADTEATARLWLGDFGGVLVTYREEA